VTVTVNVQDAVLLEASVAVQVTVVTPFWKVEPEAGTQAAVAPGQLSVGVGVVNVATAEHKPRAVFSAMLVGQVIAGFWLSLTVTVKVQAVVLLEASVAVQVTVVTPLWKVEPEAGTQAAVAPGQLSVGVGVAYVATAVQIPAAVFNVIFAGHVIAGGILSLTVTVKVQDAVFSEASVAVHVTVVVPLAKLEPEAGTQATVAPEQLSEGVGVV